MPTLFKITRQYEETRANDAGKFVLMHVTKFTVGDDGPFEVTMPAADFDAQANAALVQARAQQVVDSRAAVNG